MDPRVKEALREVAHEGPAIPFRTLVHRLHARGMVVNESLLRRMLAREDSGVRLLDPWEGPQGELARYLGPAVSGVVREPLPPGRETWIVPTPDGDDDPPDPGAPCALRVRWPLRYLGRHLDARSPGDVSRWIGMIQEAGGIGEAA